MNLGAEKTGSFKAEGVVVRRRSEEEGKELRYRI
jgi:hypothetical protein